MQQQQQRQQLLYGQPQERSSIVAVSPWTTLNPESLVAAPCLLEQTLCQSSDDQPQLAKDKAYAQAVLDAWRTEEQNSDTIWETEWCTIEYTTEDETSPPLYGYLIQSSRGRSQQQQTLRPGIVFFHTGAGPHDLFLLYKAASLVHSFSRDGVLILIADILSDDSGWAWDPDRTRYNQVRDRLLLATNDDRALLRQRVQAALRTIQQQLITTSSSNNNNSQPKIACLGWCLGGHAILEVAKLQQHDTVRALATFHGVFDGATAVPTEEEEEMMTSPSVSTEVLICHGTQDPFCSNESLEQALSLLQTCRCRTSLLQLANAKHGFTNPAQEFNDQKEFDYDATAAQKAWKQNMNLLERTLK